MGSMSFGGLSAGGKIFILLLICGIGYGGYNWYTTNKFDAFVEKGNVSLSRGNYNEAIGLYKSALDAKSTSKAQAEVDKLVKNVQSMVESESTKLMQEITAVIGDKYAGIEGSNVVAIRKGYYSAVEIESVQKKIDRLVLINNIKTSDISKTKMGTYQETLNKQKNQIKLKR